ncbi:uncharacterized protein LOC124373401 [Homalodisca vitripennis]|uniref:uncharacterized protein LOC124373401 n=1 Tax=Homalodisca vitripennis TaxID=197043 RepID=UPI001EECB953|nr:uncharacterized protein LOC124373401 [Homalodisca vitripennis]
MTSSQMTTLQATGSQVNGLDFTPSDDEDFNIIVVEADVHHLNPNSTFKTSRLTDCLKTSSALNCKPPLNSKTLAEDQTLDDFFSSNIAFYKEHMAVNYNIMADHNKKHNFLETTHRKKAKLKHPQKPKTFTRIFINSQLKLKV